MLQATTFNLNSYKDVFITMPHNSPNGSLWTLPFEFRYYILILVFGWLGLTKRKWLLLLSLLGVAATLFLHLPEPLEYFIRHTFKLTDLSITYVCLPICFAIGMLLYSFKDYVRLNSIAALACLILFFAVTSWLWKVLFLLYAVLVFALHPQLYFPRLNFKTDLSYGVYVLSWPIQQTLIYCEVTKQPYSLFIYSMLLALHLAFVSWTFFESPALKMKSRLSRNKPAI